MDSRQTRHTITPGSRAPLQGGFTFLEVIVALALLAVSASLLIGMEGAAVRRTIRDANAQQAMLAARRIMASVEAIDDKDFNLSSQDNRSVTEILDALGVPPNQDQTVQGSTAALTASLFVEDLPIPLPNAVVDPMKKITLTITWGRSRDDTVTIYYARTAGT